MVISVALIGSGIWAREEHLPAVQDSKHLKLKAVFSRTQKSAKTITNSCPGVDVHADDAAAGYIDLLKRSDIDAVIISLPIKNQNKYIREALLAGKHVLSEKPVAENIREAEDTIKWYRSEISGPTWCVAENWRFLKSFDAACDQVKELGRVIGFQVRSFDNVRTDWNFYNTDWRKNPTHQGGFLLDGGVHFTAGIRKLLEAAGDYIERTSAFTSLNKDYLPPVDTINATLRTESGISGTFQLSVGTTLRGNEWTVACEGGVVSVNNSEVKIVVNGEEITKVVPNERTGVPPEIRAWGEALAAGRTLKDQEPEAAIGDLELIELMLRSGGQGGAPMCCRYQKIVS